MSGLNKILERANELKLRGGGAVSADTISRLTAYRKQQTAIFIVTEALLIAGVVFCAYYFTQKGLNATEINVLTGVIGLGTGGGLEFGRRIWKEWAQTDLLLTLFSEASEAQVNATIEKLISKL